ncbi:peptidoglycan/LPS O-acetylase OafA/YrhL [Planotetraspora sp. GP83]
MPRKRYETQHVSMNELTRSDEMSLAGAALRGAPWKAAAISGAVVAATSLFMGWILPGPADLTWALCVGISLFSLVAGIGAISRPQEGDRVTRQARLWSLRHPWRFALYPGLGAAILMYPVQLVVDGEGVFGAAWDALWGGALVYLITGVLTLSMRGRAKG